jgi:hypothetical protein
MGQITSVPFGSHVDVGCSTVTIPLAVRPPRVAYTGVLPMLMPFTVALVPDGELVVAIEVSPVHQELTLRPGIAHPYWSIGVA